MQQNHFPTRLKSARQQAGLSLRDLTTRLNNKISRQSISQYENGAMRPSHTNLLRLCAALGVSIEYFNRPVIELTEIEFRELEKLPVKERQKIEAKAADFLGRFLELEDLLGAEIRFENILSNNLITSFEDVEKVAIELREKWGLGENPIPNIVELLEEKGIKVCEVEADDAFTGMAATAQAGIHLIVLNSTEFIPVDRKRFTALHELAHILLAFEESIDKELACHYFAKAMLFPKSRIAIELGKFRKKIHLGELIAIKEQYGISIQATLHRLRDLNIISENHYKQQREMINKRGWKKVEPGKYYGQEHSHRMKQLVYRGIAEDLISTSKAASLYGMNLAEFRRMLNQAF